MELIESLEHLAAQNWHGLGFLAAYGTTWVICGVFWRAATARTAAYVTLFQGVVAFPVALALSFSIGALGESRSVPDEITQLSVLIGVSQVLGLPFLIYLVVKHQYALVPFAFAIVTSMHFLLYSWLYQTLAYIVMASFISVGTMIVMLTAPTEELSQQNKTAPMRVCWATGGLLLATAAYFLVLNVAAG